MSTTGVSDELIAVKETHSAQTTNSLVITGVRRPLTDGTPKGN
ncbi:MAG: hypothetical protein CM15mP58_22720 [Burkholderiaceae bacterium]|nr:MAG: hypothetical protein CM15mP58_22720 [Burkholderiaceae bacterium]